MLLDIMQPIFSCQNKVNPDFPDSSIVLYIEVGQYHLAYYTVHTNGDIFTDYELYNTADRINADTVVEFLKNTNVFQKKYHSVVFVHHSAESVLIPQVLFISGTESELISTTHGDAVAYTFFKDGSYHSDIINVFAIDAKINAVSTDLFPKVSHTHINSILLKDIDRREIQHTEDLIEMIFYPSSFHLTVLKGRDVQFLQTFYFETKDDISYYLSSAIQEFAINPDTLKLSVCGFIKDDSIFMSTIRQHIPQVELLNPQVPISIPAEAEFPLHYFTPIFISTQCESSVEN
ncbi:MAG: DUF3822 family protein [bacterium]